MARSTHTIHGKVVAITGAGRGIGRATAKALIQRGAVVAIGDRDLDTAERTAAELGTGCVALHVDVTQRPSVDWFVDEAERRLGPIDVLINNAGIMPTYRFIEESDASIERQFAVNVHGVIHGMRAVIPRMLERGDGHIINIASTAGRFGVPGIATYCATKYAVVGLTDALRAELRDTPIDVSLVMPVVVRTELTDGVPDTPGIKALQPEDVAASIVEAVSSRRYEVWCPRRMKAVHAMNTALPLRLTDAIGRLTKTEDSLMASVDNPERQAYLDRISRPSELAPAAGTTHD
jgi:NADP-dependent 3-hydroxy acid dehydrogenase YdfG